MSVVLSRHSEAFAGVGFLLYHCLYHEKAWDPRLEAINRVCMSACGRYGYTCFYAST